MPVQESRRLEQTVRKVAFGRPVPKGDIRSAVRDLVITALRSRMLTIANVTAVAEAIELGIDPSRAGVKSDAQVPVKQALEGLQLALSQALLAIEIALREYTSIGGRLPAQETRAAAEALEQLAKGLAASSRDRQTALAGTIGAHIAELRKRLAAAESEDASEGTYVVGLLASGALLGLIEPKRAA